MSASGGEGYELFYTNPQSVEAVGRHIARFVTITDTGGMQAEWKTRYNIGKVWQSIQMFQLRKQGKKETLNGFR
jgi:hypothetical protein